MTKLALVGLGGFEDSYPSEVSGGMRNRAGLARALALDPDILFLDEPSAGLDPLSSRHLDDLILELRASLGTTFIVITHELPSIFAIADDAIFLDGERHAMMAHGPAQGDGGDHHRSQSEGLPATGAVPMTRANPKIVGGFIIGGTLLLLLAIAALVSGQVLHPQHHLRLLLPGVGPRAPDRLAGHLPRRSARPGHRHRGLHGPQGRRASTSRSPSR